MKLLKWLGVVVLGLVACYLILAVVIFVMSYSSHVEDDSDLGISYSEVPKEENAFFEFKGVVKSLKISDKENKLLISFQQNAKLSFTINHAANVLDSCSIVYGTFYKVMLNLISKNFSKDSDEAKIYKIIDQNKEALSFFMSGIEKSRLQIPKEAKDDPWTKADADRFKKDMKNEDTMLHFDTSMIKVTRLLYSIAILEFNKGNHIKAYQTLLKGYKLSWLFLDRRDGWMSAMMGKAIQGMISYTMNIMVPYTELGSDEILSIVNEMKQYRITEKHLRNIIKAEYAWIIENTFRQGGCGIDAFECEGDSEYCLGFFPFDWMYLFEGTCNKQKSDIAKTYREMLELVSLSHKERVARIPKQDDSLLGLALTILLAMSDPVMMISANLDYLMFMNLAQVNYDLSMILLAIKAYQLEAGDLPKKLESLTPKYLEKVPVDRFDNEKMRYSRKSKKVWSVGNDFKDNNGIPKRKTSMMMDEPMVEILF